MKPRKPMIRVNFYLSQKQIQALRRISMQAGLTFSEHLRRAIDEYLERKKKE